MVLDPTNDDRLWVAISAVGVFGTDDGGATWSTMNAGVRADFAPDPFPEFGQCPHKLLGHPAMPERLYQQNHCGVFRSDDGGRQWLDMSDGLPSRFGFVLGIHASDPDTIYVVPEDSALNGEVGGFVRYVTDAKFRVFRSRNAGADWEPLSNGLPQGDAYLHLMREGMATDPFDDCGIYLGTTTGQIFASRDDGDSWELLRRLPAADQLGGLRGGGVANVLNHSTSVVEALSEIMRGWSNKLCLERQPLTPIPSLPLPGDLLRRVQPS